MSPASDRTDAAWVRAVGGGYPGRSMPPADHPPPDLYLTLEVEPDADAFAIRAAYLRLMRDSHPDLHPGDPVAVATAQRLNAAYAVLSDPGARAGYDRTRRARDAALRNSSGLHPARDVAIARQAYSDRQHDVRAAFHAASVRVGVGLFAVGALLLVALSLM